MNIFSLFAQHIHSCIYALEKEGVLKSSTDVSRITVEPPRDASHGDIATNAAMVLAKEAGMKPRDLAEKIAEKLGKIADIKTVDVAGPGFINITADENLWGHVLGHVLKDDNFGRSHIGENQKINVEYVSANPTGPMHVGHCRGAVFGDALANLLDFAGFSVTREYYINDAGAQVDVLARSAHLRYREALGETIVIPEGLYPGDYLKAVGIELAARFGDSLKYQPESVWLEDIRTLAIDAMMEQIRGDLKALNIQHDIFFSERGLSTPEDKVGAMLAALRADGLVYEGHLEPPKGQPVDDWEDREQTLFRASQFGDDVDRPLLKSDGGYTYFASDIAYHADKFSRGFKHQIDVWGADHGGYVKRMQAALKAVSKGQADLDVKLVQLVRLFRNGEPVKMSKRAGEFVTLRDVVDEVGVDPVRFMMVFRKNDALLDFDFAKVLEQSRENPVFYVQYAHARGHSTLRKGAENAGRAFNYPHADFSLLSDEGEIKLIQHMAQFPRIVESAALAHEPHRIAFYAHELASLLHSHWNKGKDSPQLRFIVENNDALTEARLALVEGVTRILKQSLAILGVSAPEEMR